MCLRRLLLAGARAHKNGRLVARSYALLAGILLTNLALALEWTVPYGSCPSITASGFDHSDWFAFINKGENFQAWQVYCTTGHARDLQVYIKHFPIGLNCSAPYVSSTVNDKCANITITVYNATMNLDDSCSDEGTYQLEVCNKCTTCDDTIVFHLNFNSPCTSDFPPTPARPRTVVVPEPRPGDPTTLRLTMSYIGDTDENHYDTRWLRGGIGYCGNGPSLVCTDDDIPGYEYRCKRQKIGNCTFLSELYIVNYTTSFSGEYATLSCAVSTLSSGEDSTHHPSKTTTLDLRILCWPRLIQWPGDTLSTGEGMATLSYQLSNYSHEFIDLTFYNGSELMNVSSNQVEIICENANCETATIRLTVLTEGEYKMCYNFSNMVQWTPRDDPAPAYMVPNCTEVTHVVTNIPTLALEIVGPVIGVIVILAILVVLLIWVKFRKCKTPDTTDGETDGLLGSHTQTVYGSSDATVPRLTVNGCVSESTGEEPAITSEHVSTQEIPTGNSPASATNDPVLTQDCPVAGVAVGRQSGGDEASSPNTRNEASTCTDEATTAVAVALAPAPSAGVQYSDDDVDKDSPYPKTRKKHVQELPNPQRYEHPIFGLLKKVFILFPHNPSEYTQPGLPTQQPMSSAITREFGKEVEQKEHQEITRHQKQVYKFACFLQRNYIAVAYDLMLKDTAVSDDLKWVDNQINDSDYVILIITPSFSTYLDDPPPREKECIFGTDYVSRLVRYPKKTKFLVVFLNREKDEGRLPTNLRGHTLYKICEPFEIGETRHDDLEDLYAVLTNQKRYTPSEPLRVVPLTKQSDTLTEDQQRLYEDLSRLDTEEVTRELITRIAQKQCVFQHYKRLAIILGIPAFERKIEETSEEGDEEICYQLLLAWKGQPNTDTTIKTLAKALVKIDPSLLVELNSAVFL